MTRRTRRIAKALATVAITFATYAITPAANADEILEDDPRWDCATMGNLICGPVGEPGEQWWQVCWLEPNTEMPDGYELIAGPDFSLMPAGSIRTECPR